MKARRFYPLFALLLGQFCMKLRQILYATAVDAVGLLETGTALEWGIYLLSALALLLFILWSRRPQPEAIPVLTAAGRLAGSVGIGWTVLVYSAQMPGLLGLLWKGFGAAAALCLLASAVWALRGRQIHFLCLLVPCLFWLVHMLDNYRGWSGQPQLQSYLFALLGTLSMTLVTYYTAAAAVGLGRPRRQNLSALSAAYFCCATAMPGDTQLLYLLSGFWAMTCFDTHEESELP